MKKNSFREQVRIGDYVGFCDTCGQKFWASQGKILDKYTGLGGAWVCPNCRDHVHYGLVPYVIEPEKQVPISRSGEYTANPSDVPNTPAISTLDFTTMPPRSSGH